ncbi:hypothetical protein FRC01_004015 [Tulasnella sp. 417]|nr:hypothetical protein FRC01_004015 [Tulasnella sp. 417]
MSSPNQSPSSEFPNPAPSPPSEPLASNIAHPPVASGFTRLPDAVIHEPADNLEFDTDDSIDVFQFNLQSLQEFREEDEESDVEDTVDDSEFRQWLKDSVGENWEEVYHQTQANSLSISDMDNICGFALHHESCMSRRVYRMMGKAFDHRMKLEQSDYLLYRRMDNLSGIQMERYDMCQSSCCAFTRPDLVNLTENPNQVYRVVPITPRLRTAWANKEMAEELMYRAFFSDEPGSIKDIVNSGHYCSLLMKQVAVDGEILPHHYFDQPTDIALGHAMDRVSLFKSRNHHSTCTPIITIIYNLSPEIRSRCSNVLINAVIPGPRAPKDTDSFMYPITQEAGVLACGVEAYNALDQNRFDMRAYYIRAFGDMVAMYKSMGMTSPGGKYHCHRCKIKGVLAPGKTTYYCPLHGPSAGDMEYDPRNLPLRSHKSFIETINELAQSSMKQERQVIARETGVSDRSYIFDFPGCDMVYSTPFDFMHLFFKNNAENQIKIWKGCFKTTIDDRDSEYILESHIWEVIGQEMVAANKTIPVVQPSLDCMVLVMERICFLVKSCVTSKLHPYGTIDQRIKRDAQLTAIKLRYNLQGRLDLSTNGFKRDNSEPKMTEKVYDDYPISALRPPCLQNFQPLDGERSRLLSYLYGYYDAKTTQGRKAIASVTPKTMMRWGKVWRLDRSEKIHGSVAMRDNNRDSSYIRYEALIDRNMHLVNEPIEFRRIICYGQLHYLIDFWMPGVIINGTYHASKHHILGFVTPCKTEGKDATSELVLYPNGPSGLQPQRFISLSSIECAVGRVKSRDRWWIVDRSDGLARTSFMDEEDSDAEG